MEVSVMNNKIEKVMDTKNKIDQVINLYVEKDNAILEIPEENVYMEFSIGDQDYVAFSESSDDEDEMDMMFAKSDVLANVRVLRSIDVNEEYDDVLTEFSRRLELIENLD